MFCRRAPGSVGYPTNLAPTRLTGPVTRPRAALATAAAMALGAALLLPGATAAQPLTTQPRVDQVLEQSDDQPATAPTEVTTTEAMVPVGPEPDGQRVRIDTTTYVPAGEGPHPAVLATHGFGGSKADLDGLGRRLAAQGYVVLAYSARGFGDSGGRIHVADPDFEVADARLLLDELAARDDVLRDGRGDPRVAAVGASYSGALALMTAATDDRVDTVVAAITWNDLAEAFFPQAARSRGPGPFKQLWASRFFLGSAARPGGPASQGSADPVCGRFDPEICALFLDASRTGEASDALLGMLAAHSPAPLLEDLRAPTYLVQGLADSLFGTDQSDATAAALTERGTPVAVRWTEGGHDSFAASVLDEAAGLERWLDHYLDPGLEPQRTTVDDLPLPPFSYSVPPAPGRERDEPQDFTTSDLPLPSYDEVPLDPEPRPVLNPPGGVPASLTTVPGTGDALVDAVTDAVSTYPLAALPGQSVAFDTEPLESERILVGSPRVRLSVTSSAPTSTLFLSLWQVTPDDTAVLTRQLVAPVRIATTPGEARTVDVDLAGGTWRVPAGSRLRVLVTTTDQTYSSPRAARADVVRVDQLRLPSVAGTPVDGSGGGPDAEVVGLLVALGVLLAASVLVPLVRRRRTATAPDPALADVPLVVEGLVKTYADGHRAVDDVSWTAGRGQVVGLLGPNGAGKTTTLRMVMGLIRPDSGRVHVLGEQVHPGSPVLARVGALVEGPGFLPHLTGRQNLHAYWAATGRPEEEARFEEVLEVAALGGAVERPVRTYSQGMRQRLGIAQAMLGFPEVLVLDEPTNGLDPPQIAGLRPILQRYAAAGRTVIVSSHLLAEVEMTCSHVVVMHAGRVIVTGTVAELVDSAGTTLLTLAAGSDPDPVADVVRRQPGVSEVEVLPAEDPEGSPEPVGPRLVVTSDLPRAEVVRLVAGTGADLVAVSSRRQLEEVFLGVIAEASGADPDLRQVRAR